jgi:hypothetical protein
MDTRTVIALPDFQVPYHDEKAVKVIFKYLEKIRVDEVILMGDFMDIYTLSSHSKGKPGQLENKQLQKEFDAGNEMLDRIEKAARKKNKKCKITFLEGNHEFRTVRYAEEYPVLRETVDIERNLRLKQRGIKYVLCYTKGDVYNIGNAYFHHGLYTGGNHAKKHVDNFGVNIFYGHTHDVNSQSKVLWGKDKTIVGQSLGCLCDYKQCYIKGNPTNWQHAFGIFYFLPDGYFTYYVPRLFHHRFVDPGGKVWG